MNDDIERVEEARNAFGMHKTFGPETFEEIISKLSMGWSMLSKDRMAILSEMDNSETKELDIIGNRRAWTLRHIFGLEPINLKTMENNPKDYSMTVQVINLGTSDMFADIQAKPGTSAAEPRVEDITEENGSPMPEPTTSTNTKFKDALMQDPNLFSPSSLLVPLTSLNIDDTDSVNPPEKLSGVPNKKAPKDLPSLNSLQEKKHKPKLNGLSEGEISPKSGDKNGRNGDSPSKKDPEPEH